MKRLLRSVGRVLAANRWRRVLAAFVMLAPLCFAGAPAVADDGLPPSPAMAVGQRLMAEAEQTWAAAAVAHQAGKPADAYNLRQTARGQAKDAIKNGFSVVVASATYGHGPVGAEALVAEARLERDILG